jgi:pimeloyl-ACP methyl ester carboxylesterase
LQLSPRNQSAFDDAKASSAAFIKDVEEWSSPPGIVQYVSAREAAHDYEQVRIALGYDKVNFVGLS